jgi:hypothetical protein
MRRTRRGLRAEEKPGIGQNQKRLNYYTTFLPKKTAQSTNFPVQNPKIVPAVRANSRRPPVAEVSAFFRFPRFSRGGRRPRGFFLLSVRGYDNMVRNEGKVHIAIFSKQPREPLMIAEGRRNL